MLSIAFFSRDRKAVKTKSLFFDKVLRSTNSGTRLSRACNVTACVGKAGQSKHTSMVFVFDLLQGSSLVPPLIDILFLGIHSEISI